MKFLCGHKTKCPVCGCILMCFRRNCPVHIIGQNIEIWVEHCRSRVLTSCTILVAVLTIFNRFFMTNFNVRPSSGILCPRILSLSCEGHITPIFWTNLELFSSVPLVPNRSSTKILMTLATDFPVAGLLAMGSSVFSNTASICDLSRSSVRTSPVPYCCSMVLCYQCSQARSRYSVEYST